MAKTKKKKSVNAQPASKAVEPIKTETPTGMVKSNAGQHFTFSTVGDKLHGIFQSLDAKPKGKGKGASQIMHLTDILSGQEITAYTSAQILKHLLANEISSGDEIMIIFTGIVQLPKNRTYKTYDFYFKKKSGKAKGK